MAATCVLVVVVRLLRCCTARRSMSRPPPPPPSPATALFRTGARSPPSGAGPPRATPQGEVSATRRSPSTSWEAPRRRRRWRAPTRSSAPSGRRAGWAAGLCRRAVLSQSTLHHTTTQTTDQPQPPDPSWKQSPQLVAPGRRQRGGLQKGRPGVRRGGGVGGQGGGGALLWARVGGRCALPCSQPALSLSRLAYRLTLRRAARPAN